MSFPDKGVGGLNYPSPSQIIPNSPMIIGSSKNTKYMSLVYYIYTCEVVSLGGGRIMHPHRYAHHAGKKP